MATFKFELVSPERILMSVDAEEVVVPGSDGEMTVMAGHAPLVTTLRPGVLDISSGGSRKRVFVKRGFAEVDATHVTILADTAIEVEAMTPERIAAERKLAEEELAGAIDDDARHHAQAAIASFAALSA
jgi:F-type H+-transporting ATPase subunit epsilon